MLLQTLKIGDKIGEILGCEALGQAARHQRDPAWFLSIDLVSRDSNELGIRILNLNECGILAANDPGQNAAVGQRESRWLVARRNLGRGIQDRRDQFVARVFRSDARKLRPDLAAFLTDRVAFDTRQPLGVSE